MLGRGSEGLRLHSFSRSATQTSGTLSRAKSMQPGEYPPLHGAAEGGYPPLPDVVHANAVTTRRYERSPSTACRYGKSPLPQAPSGRRLFIERWLINRSTRQPCLLLTGAPRQDIQNLDACGECHCSIHIALRDVSTETLGYQGHSDHEQEA